MNKLKCLIVDDEPLALELIESYVLKTPFLHLISKCSNAFQAMDALANNVIDLIFLDIQMPELNGMQLSKIIDKKTKIVFTTAFAEYAIEGYKVDAMHYLLKPFNYEEFLFAANKAKQWFQDFRSIDSQMNSQAETILVKSGYKTIAISLAHVLYIEGLKDYVKFYLDNIDKPVISLMSMKSVEEKLSSNSFLRVHRSYIVNINKIASIDRNRIMFGTTYIPISDKYKDEFQQFIDKHYL